MAHAYNLRSSKFDQEKFNTLLHEIFPSKYMKDKLAKPESEPSDSDFETESEDEDDDDEDEDEDEDESDFTDDSINVNITFTVNHESDDEVPDEKTTEFLEQVEKMGESLSIYKELPMYKKMVKTHQELSQKSKEAKAKHEKKEKKKNEDTFETLLKNKPMNDVKYFQGLTLEEQGQMLAKLTSLRELDKQNKPNSIKLLESEIPDEYKLIAFQKMSQLKKGSDGDIGKIRVWLDGFMKIPFGKYHTLPISLKDGTELCHAFLEKAKQQLDDSTYGLQDAKTQIIQYIGRLISNPQSTGTAIAIEGPMGTGKTTLVKEGISTILKRPFAFIALGGATDSSTFDGHMITYEGSVWGQIVDILMKCKCMNPVFYFDELDKVSETPKGDEIISILTHLTDPAQNSVFQDKYFTGVDLDLSRCLFVFSYNDRTKINPILRDRMYVIKTEGYTTEQKCIIAKNYLTKTIRQNISFSEQEVVFEDAAIKCIIECYTGEEKGVRNLKRCLETIYSKLNLFRLMKPDTNLFNTDLPLTVTFPYTVTIETVRLLLKLEEVKSYTMMYM